MRALVILGTAALSPTVERQKGYRAAGALCYLIGRARIGDAGRPDHQWIAAARVSVVS
jgi:hypothetical protein